MLLIPKLQKIIDDHHLLKHMFYIAWSNGSLDQTILKKYSQQYYKQVGEFPRFISSVHTNCPYIDARKVLLENLNDEELHGTDHPTLWMQFAEGLGATRQEVLDDEPLPETRVMVDTYYELAKRDWRDGLCALYAYEYQVPSVAASKIAGLKQFYGIQDEKTLEFFVAHQTYDVLHAEQVAKLIERYVDQDRAEKATTLAVKALCTFLDGMCRVGGISC